MSVSSQKCGWKMDSSHALSMYTHKFYSVYPRCPCVLPPISFTSTANLLSPAYPAKLLDTLQSVDGFLVYLQFILHIVATGTFKKP